jgi:hypothetical protein
VKAGRGSPHGQSLTFVVSSGRCGSTAVSDTLRVHPRVLSLSEFFRCIGTAAFQPGQFTSEQFWRLLAEPRQHATAILRYHLEPPEILYRPGPHTRYGRESGVPPILLITLPHLSDEPERLFDEIHAFTVSLPTQPLPDHFRSLFAWLAQRFCRDAIVERSGASLAMLPNLVRSFPEARFIHLYRDGRRVAVSMSRHIIFRLWLAVRHTAGSSLPEDILDELGSRVLAGLPPREAARLTVMSQDSRIRLLLREMGPAAEQEQSPVWRFGTAWTGLVLGAAATLNVLAAHQLFSLDFDDLLTAPESGLSAVERFLFPAGSPGGTPGGIPAGQWVARAGTILRPDTAPWDAGLSDVEWRRLVLACRPAMKWLYGPSATLPAGISRHPVAAGVQHGR